MGYSTTLGRGMLLMCGAIALLSECSSRDPAAETVRSVSNSVILPSGTQSTFSCGPNSTGATNTDNGDTSAPCVITRTQIDEHTIKIRIDRPVVHESSYAYPIQFQPGDLVTVSDAGGCAQTGGEGKTWKRYVDPAGNESDHIYFGGITVPGAHDPALGNEVVDDIRLSSIKGQTLTVPNITNLPCQGVSVPSNLTLTYKDENGEFGNNGYYSRDSGNGCDSLPDAFVELTIAQGLVSSEPVVSLASEFDVVDSGFDCNLVQAQPRWGWQQPSAILCSSSNDPAFDDPADDNGCVGFLNEDAPQTAQQTSYDPAPFRDPITHPDELLLGLICSPGTPFELNLQGHLNWSEVTYTGTLNWDSWDSPLTGDDDYNVLIRTKPIFGNAPGTTAANSDVKGEFDSDETIDLFDSDPWWKTLHDLVDPPWNQGVIGDPVADFLNGHDAVMVGVLGMDEAHEPKSEIHPVHALAIRTASPGVGTNGTPLDRWAFFVRNWGDEGECSQFQHYLDLNQLTLQLPRPAGVPATATAVLRTTANSPAGMTTTKIFEKDTNNQWSVAPSLPNQDFLVSFSIGTGTTQGIYDGEIVLEWSQATAASAASIQFGPAPQATSSVTPPPDQDEVGDDLNGVFSALTPAQQVTFVRAVADGLPPKPVPVTHVATRGPDAFPVRPSGPPTLSIGPATREEQRQKAHIRAFCVATSGGHDVAQPLTCPKVEPFATVTATPALAGIGSCFFAPWTITLTGIDGSGAGIDHLEYSLDGTTFVRYAQSLTLSPGATLRYRAVDKAGTVGTARTYVVPSSSGGNFIASATLFANGSLDLRDGSQINGASINAGQGPTTIGVETILGTIESQASVLAADRARVNGALTTAGIFTPGNGVVVTGALSQHATLQLPSLDLCRATFTGTSNGDVSLEPDQSRTLVPGQYGNIVVKSRATLRLPPGIVEISSLDLEPSSTLVVSATQPTLLLVSGSVIWRGTGSAPLFLGVFGSGTTFIESPFSGSLVQPAGSVVIRALTGPSLVGQVFAKNVSVDAHAIITPAYLFGSVPTGPSDVITACDGLCNPSTAFGSGFATVLPDSSAVCFETNASLRGGTCSNFGSARPLSIDGVVMPCDGTIWPGLPAKRSGGYCIQAPAGTSAGAALTTW